MTEKTPAVRALLAICAGAVVAQGSAAPDIGHPDIFGIRRGWEIGNSCSARSLSIEEAADCNADVAKTIDDEYILVGLWFFAWYLNAMTYDIDDAKLTNKSAEPTDYRKHFERLVAEQFITLSKSQLKLFLNTSDLCAAIPTDCLRVRQLDPTSTV
jgi:hypothetical protein